MNRKDRKRFYKNDKKTNSKSELKSGAEGILFTCDQGKENMGMKEAYQMIERYSEINNGSDDESEDDNKADNPFDAIDKELNELKNKSKNDKNKLYRIETGCKGVIMVGIKDKSIDVSQLCEVIMKDVIENKESVGRYCCKIRPLNMTCRAKEENIIEIIKPLISEYFTEEKESIEYRVEIERRNNSNVNRVKLTDLLVKLIPSKHVVNVKNPNTIILVEIFKSIAGVSILPKWIEHKEYNLRCNHPKSMIEIENDNKSRKRKLDDENDENVKKPKSENSDWRCEKCDKPNFGNRTVCFNCGEEHKKS